jgi:uncharacterized protein (TIGR03437 family)
MSANKSASRAGSGLAFNGDGRTDLAIAAGNGVNAFLGTMTSVTLVSRSESQGVSIQVLFAGLLPGAIGMYQVDVVVPADWHESPLLSCSVTGSIPVTASGETYPIYGYLPLAH